MTLLSITSFHYFKIILREKRLWKTSHDSKGTKAIRRFYDKLFRYRDIAKSVPSINLENLHL